jgi:hypothetical protein
LPTSAGKADLDNNCKIMGHAKVDALCISQMGGREYVEGKD